MSTPNDTPTLGSADSEQLRACEAPLRVVDLGSMAYQEAFETQRRWHDAVLGLRESDPESACIGALLLVEHDPPVITISRRPGARAHLIASDAQLADAGVTVEETDRGGDITYHGPGQLVAYPIVDLNRIGKNLHAYMRLLEDVVIAACGGFGVPGTRDDSATGVWVDGAKLCAMGVRIRRWVTMHGLALNVDPEMDHFNLIVPCGLAGRSVTSLRRLLGDSAPTMEDSKAALVDRFQHTLGSFGAGRRV